MKSLKVAKMNMQGVVKPAIIYYTIFMAIATVTIISSYISDGSVSMSGVESATIIFLFVCGLNCFKANFYFAKSSNVTRKTFIKGLMISASPIAVSLSIIDIIINRITNIFVENPTFYDMAFEGSFNEVNYDLGQRWIQSNAFGDIFNTLLFHFSLCLLAYVAGIVISMIYYRCNKIMKVIVTIVPIAIITFGGNLIYLNTEISNQIGKVMNYIFGFEPVNVYSPVITFLVTTLVLCSLSFLLIRKAIIKER